jgi:aspartate aminotransferase-like enzyme/GNAT superfamily N-acetyltransferase
MHAYPPLRFKIATEGWEFEAIHRLNYRTFVEEIPQHTPASEPRLVDKFHAQNTYFICLGGDQLIGMIAFRGERPFSLDQKLPDLDAHLPPGRHVCEIRLLAVERGHRNGVVLRGLLDHLVRFGRAQGYNLAVISGTVRQLKLYQHMGFTPFGPPVGEPGAQFQPMQLKLEAYDLQAKTFLPETGDTCRTTVNLLPGPVEVHPEVHAALAQPPVSHRSDRFLLDLAAARHLLGELTHASRVEILVGSGTLANDVLGGQLKLESTPGLVLANGEFGERLLDHAHRWGLEFEAHQLAWGEPFDLAVVGAHLDRLGRAGWLWAVHSETSTGMLNDLAGLKRLCAARNVKLCLDCISSLGTLPLDLRSVYFASGVSGKGLAAYPGLSLLFYHHRVAPSPGRLPRYLDLGCYASADGVAYTHSSNLLGALLTALRRLDDRRYAMLARVGLRLRSTLRGAGFELVSPEDHAAPAVVTLALPPTVCSHTLGRRLEQAGYLLSYGSEYLLRRNWIQVCLMGCFAEEKLDALVRELRRAVNAISTTPDAIGPGRGAHHELQLTPPT